MVILVCEGDQCILLGIVANDLILAIDELGMAHEDVIIVVSLAVVSVLATASRLQLEKLSVFRRLLHSVDNLVNPIQFNATFSFFI